MKIRYIFLLSAVLVCSAIIFNQLDHLLTPGSTAILISRISLVIMDFVLIIYFFNRLRSADMLFSTQIVNLIASAIVIIFCLVQAIVG